MKMWRLWWEQDARRRDCPRPRAPTVSASCPVIQVVHLAQTISLHPRWQKGNMTDEFYSSSPFFNNKADFKLKGWRSRRVKEKKCTCCFENIWHLFCSKISVCVSACKLLYTISRWATKDAAHRLVKLLLYITYCIVIILHIATGQKHLSF